jgi:hypothetical protein
MIKRWTEREDDILRAFWKTNEPFSDAMRLLPGRTEAAIRMRGQWIGAGHRKPGPKPQVEKCVIKLLKNHAPLSSFEMGEMLLCDRRLVDQYLRKLRAKKRIYIASYIETRNGKLSRRFAMGSEPDMPYPPKSQRAGIPTAIVASKPVKKNAIQIDPITAALFGRAA